MPARSGIASRTSCYTCEISYPCGLAPRQMRRNRGAEKRRCKGPPAGGRRMGRAAVRQFAMLPDGAAHRIGINT
ncbi:hypothetical protein CBM2629_A150281 [Cupriavidus taiwanensis]|nr:hypothetical protein CBM2629_A150281 [Cupriavidus taiwanensis]